MIVVTGAAGFIGSAMVAALNAVGQTDLILVDDFSTAEKNKNLIGKKFNHEVERSLFFEWLNSTNPPIEAIIHLGAKTDTTLFDYKIFDELNIEYSKRIWNYAVEKNIPLIYASSAATYGSGELGYNDDESIIPNLKPLNPYGESKNEFDKWVLTQTAQPPNWIGLKFFNVYGPNEYHKSRMASVVFHAFNQINESAKVKLFRSHHPDFKDGQQLRDFIYVKDVIGVIQFLLAAKIKNGIYNLGTGKARSFNDLVNAIFKTLNVPSAIEYIDTPLDIRDKYQYFTEANMNKLIAEGYQQTFTTLEDGVKDYVLNYLMEKKYF